MAFFLFLLHLLLPLASATPLFLTCGSPTSISTPDKRVFLPDSPFLPNPSKSHLVSNLSSHPNNLYSSARIFPKPTSYSFRVPSSGTHLLRLHFHPFKSPSCDFTRARFHVLASKSVLLTDFRVDGGISKKVGSCGVHRGGRGENGFDDLPLVLKEFFVYVDSDELVVTFLPFDRTSFAFVNAIEVIPAAGLVPDIARVVGEEGKVEKKDGFAKREFEVLYRVNAGGAKITPFNDTVWRYWVPDGEFLMPGSPSETVRFGGRIQYAKYGASDKIAPFHVYSTARITKIADLSKPGGNMTWNYFVPMGYEYLVRLHFCDIASLVLNEVYFNIFVNGKVAYEDFDLSSSAMNLARPYYVDFVARPDVSGHLSVMIAPSNSSIASKVNGLLNGLEIMKMSNSAGNLDEGINLSGHGSGSVLAFVRFVLCSFAFVALILAGFILVSRWRHASRLSAGGWSPIPTSVSEVKMSYGSGRAAGKSVAF